MLCTVYSVKSDILHLNAFARDKGVGFFFLYMHKRALIFAFCKLHNILYSILYSKNKLLSFHEMVHV